jgi:GAF domain-containing protein
LAATFNKMVAQLRQTLVGLENRAHSLEIVRSLSDRLVYILNLTELLVEIVNQLKDKFGYYHVHIYLLDDEKKNLIVAEGTGTAGAELKARGHSIRLDASVSLVARAARTGAVVKVDNVREAQDWLPNPLLPKTCSEVAVPISLEDHVVGVLDVQADEVAALKDADADLLVTLASQVAIAIRNARLFAEVEQALTEARVAQERYLEQAWVKVRSQKRGAAYLHQRPEATPLQPPLIAEIEQDIQDQDQARVVQATGADEAEIEAVVAPIKLQNQLIGAIQLHRAGQPRSWSEQEVALVQTVAEQVAQVAENLRLFEETRQRADYERLVGEISQKLRQAPNLDSLAKIMAEELGHVLGVEHSLVKVGRSTGSAGPAELSMKQDGNNGH